MFHLPAKPLVESGKLFQAYALHKDSPWVGNGTLDVIDIAAGAAYDFLDSPYDSFLHIVEGNNIAVMIAGHQVEKPHGSRTYGQLPTNALRFVNGDTNEPARVIVMQSHLEAPPINRVKPKLGLINALAYDPRPEGIKLKSLWKHTELPEGVGYEYVTIDGLVPRHMHEYSSAIWIIRDGTGYCGMDIDGEIVITPVSAGMWGYFPAGHWHGFWGKGLRFMSAQIPDIGDSDYLFDKATEYPYPV